MEQKIKKSVKPERKSATIEFNVLHDALKAGDDEKVAMSKARGEFKEPQKAKPDGKPKQPAEPVDTAAKAITE